MAVLWTYISRGHTQRRRRKMGVGEGEEWFPSPWNAANQLDASAMSLADTCSPGASNDSRGHRAASYGNLQGTHGDQREQKEGCIGMVLRSHNTGNMHDEIFVADILPGSPANLLTDIQRGDTIISVSQVKVAGMSVDHVMRLIRGPVDTFVEVKLERRRACAAHKIKIRCQRSTSCMLHESCAFLTSPDRPVVLPITPYMPDTALPVSACGVDKDFSGLSDSIFIERLKDIVRDSRSGLGIDLDKFVTDTAHSTCPLPRECCIAAHVPGEAASLQQERRHTIPGDVVDLKNYHGAPTHLDDPLSKKDFGKASTVFEKIANELGSQARCPVIVEKSLSPRKVFGTKKTEDTAHSVFSTAASRLEQMSCKIEKCLEASSPDPSTPSEKFQTSKTTIRALEMLQASKPRMEPASYHRSEGESQSMRSPFLSRPQSAPEKKECKDETGAAEEWVSATNTSGGGGVVCGNVSEGQRKNDEIALSFGRSSCTNGRSRGGSAHADGTTKGLLMEKYLSCIDLNQRCSSSSFGASISSSLDASETSEFMKFPKGRSFQRAGSLSSFGASVSSSFDISETNEFMKYSKGRSMLFSDTDFVPKGSGGTDDDDENDDITSVLGESLDFESMIIEDLRAFSMKEERAFFPIKEEDGESFGSGDRNGGEMRVNAHEWAALMRRIKRLEEENCKQKDKAPDEAGIAGLCSQRPLYNAPLQSHSTAAGQHSLHITPAGPAGAQTDSWGKDATSENHAVQELEVCLC